MCKHVFNAQCFLQCGRCARWSPCAECHDEQMSQQLPQYQHPFSRDSVLRMCCARCKKIFSLDLRTFSEADKKCVYCDALWCLPAETPESALYMHAQEALDQLLGDLVSIDTVVS
jgi:uncharacterized CHY-type Zn-finger protein